MQNAAETMYQRVSPHFPHWEKTKDLIDQFIDLELNLRQSGHPGGSRSKVHLFLTTLLSGAMRWDIRHPEKRFGDRFVLALDIPTHLSTPPWPCSTRRCAPSTSRPATRSTSCRRNAASSRKTWSTLRRNKGLPGHAEMAGKTLFFKFNTGPVRPRHAGSGRRGPGAQDGRLRAGQGLCHGRRGRTDPRRRPRDQELRLGPGPQQSLLPDRLERLRH